ncbi:unnamed protein product [Brassica oleracea]
MWIDFSICFIISSIRIIPFGRKRLTVAKSGSFSHQNLFTE